MKTLIKLEEAAMLAFAVYVNSLLPFPWWYFLAWFLSPDIGFIGYAINPRVGAVTYNVLHHRGIAIAVGVAGLILDLPPLMLAGTVLFGHCAFDRMLGYGLKYSDSFNNTHLGPIGRASRTA